MKVAVYCETLERTMRDKVRKQAEMCWKPYNEIIPVREQAQTNN